MKYDDIYEYTGQMGRYQWTVFAAMFALIVFSAETLNIIFVGADMNHWCRIDGEDDFMRVLPLDKQKLLALPLDDVETPADDLESIDDFVATNAEPKIKSVLLLYYFEPPLTEGRKRWFEAI